MENQKLKILKMFYYGTFVLIGLFVVNPIAFLAYWIYVRAIVCEPCLWVFGYILIIFMIICALAMYGYSIYKPCLNLRRFKLNLFEQIIQILGVLILGPMWGYKVFYDDHIRKD